MKYFFFLVLFSVQFVFAQEIVSPIGAIKRGAPKTITKATPTIDSTFIYTFDTLTLPFLDEFSRNNFPSFNAQPGDANVTEENYFLLLDLADVPYASTTLFSTTATKKYTTSAGTTTETDLPLISIKIADFQNYPVVYSVMQVYPPYSIYDTLDYVNTIDTVQIASPDIKQDSVTVFKVYDANPLVRWIDKHAYHNYTFALNPWTLGVATLDGVDEHGYPYAIGTTQVGYADYLTSKVIDLSANSPSDSVYFSFLYQFEGLSDPAETEDSLVLEFYNKNTDHWDWIWGKSGSPVSDFKRVHIPVDQADYFTNGFQFRFKNYGGLSGLLDIVNVDYVHLRAGSGYQDTVFKDFAFVYPLGSLIETYTQVPWEHWLATPTHMNPQVKTVVRNGSNLPENNLNGNVDVKFNAVTEGNFTMIAQDLSGQNINYAPFTTYTSYHDFTGGYVFSITPPANTKTFDIVAQAGAQFPNYALNDSSFTQQIFENVYAYDDGSAEQAYGLNQAQGRIALKFTPYKADTLMGVRMYFAPTVNDVSNKLFLITVWSDNAGVPGTVLYEDDFFNPRTPIYEDERGKFTDYILNTRLPMDGSIFYVGTRQVDPVSLNIGFDRNNPQTGKLYYSINGGVTWSASSASGVPMIRPLFQTPDNYDLSVFEKGEEVNWGVYPNPTSGIVSIQWNETQAFPGAQLIDAQGRILEQVSVETLQLDLSNRPCGIYLLKLNSGNNVLKIMR